MAKYDKYQPKAGGYRATLAEDFDAEDIGKALAVGHDADGRLVIGNGNSGIKGVLVLTEAKQAGSVVDVMTAGEIVSFGPSTAGNVPGEDFADSGVNYYGHADGTISAHATADGVYIGHTRSTRTLIVRVVPMAAYATEGSL